MSRLSRTSSTSLVRPVSLVLCFTLVFASSSFIFQSGASGRIGGASASQPHRTQGPPSPNLPNLDEARRLKPHSPKAPAPIPSKGCSHYDKACQQEKEKKKASNQFPLSYKETDLLAYHDGFSRFEPAAPAQEGNWRHFASPLLDALLNQPLRASFDAPAMLGLGRGPQNSQPAVNPQATLSTRAFGLSASANFSQSPAYNRRYRK